MDIKIFDSRYVVLSKLGEGGMGDVYLVKDILQDNKLKALKTIKEEILNDNILNSFKKEFEVMTHLRHPYLARVYDFQIDNINKLYYLTMEYVRGVSLKQSIKNGEIDEKKAIDILVKLCQVTEFIHSRNILHRDIKPSNIILYNDQIKLLDFGLSDLDITEKTQKKGTLLYMAPEILDGHIDKKIDIYSIGMTFYEMLAGDIFFQEKQSKSILSILKDSQKFIVDKNIALEKISNLKLRDIVSTMLSYKKENRFNSCSEIINAINSNLNFSYPIETKETSYAYVLGARFIDREKEIEKLKNKLSSEDNSVILSINGPKGIGKSRLFEEFKKYCQLNSIYFIEVNCIKYLSKTYSIFIDIINELLLKADISLIEKYGPELKKIVFHNKALANITQNPFYEGILERKTIISTICNFILDYCSFKGTPIVIYINDLQWIDEGSKEILEELLLNINQFKENNNLNVFLYIFSSIQSEEYYLIQDFIDKLSNFKKIKVINLEPFNLENVIKYFNAIFGEEYIDDSIYNFIPTLCEKIGGNPYFLQEIIKSFLDENIIYKKGTKWEFIENGLKIKFPDNLKDIIKTDINKFIFNKEEKELIEKFSLINSQIPFKHLKNILSDEINVDKISDIFNEFENKEILIIEKNNDSENNFKYKFANSLIKDLILENIDHISQKEYHLFLAEKFETYFSENIDDYIEEIAYHYYKSGKKDKAIFYIEASIKKLEKEYSKRALLDYYNMYLDIIDKNDKDKIFSLNIEKIKILDILSKYDESIKLSFDLVNMYYDNKKYLAELYRLIAISNIKKCDYDNAKKYADLSLNLCEELEDENGFISIYNIYGLYHWRKCGDKEKALEYFLKALELSRITNNKQNEVLILGNIGIIYTSQGMKEKAMEYYNIQLKLAEEKNDIQVLIGININLGNLYWQNAEYKTALDYFFKSLEYSNKIGERRSACNALGNIGLTYYYLGEHTKALDYFNKSLKIAQEIGYKRGISNAYGNIGLVYFNNEDFKKAFEYYSKQLEISQEMNDMQSIGASYGNLGLVNHKTGNFTQALNFYEKQLDIYSIINDFHLSVPFGNIGSVYFDQKMYYKAIEYFEKQLEIAQKMNIKRDIGIANINLGNVYKELSKYDLAEVYYNNAIKLLNDSNLYFYFCEALKNKAELYFLKNEYDEAELLNNQAMEIAKNSNAKNCCFECSILASKIKYYKSSDFLDKKSAIRELRILLSNEESDLKIADLSFEIAKMTNDPIYYEKAVFYYKKMYEKTQNVFYYDKIYELENYFKKINQKDEYKSINDKLSFENEKTEININKSYSEDKEKEDFTKTKILYDYKLNKIDYYKELLEITKELNSNLRLNALFEKILDLSISFIEANRAAIFLYNTSGDLELVLARNDQRENIKLDSFKISQTIINQVISSGKALFESSILQKKELSSAQSLLDMDVKSLMCIPLILRRKLDDENNENLYSIGENRYLLGLLYADSYSVTEESRFKGENLIFLKMLADHATIAIANAKIYEKQNIDSLTGLYLRNYFENILANKLKATIEKESSISLIIVDVESLIEINKNFGYSAGDKILIDIAKIIKNNTKGTDICSRYSGKEFAIILPDADIIQTRIFIEELSVEIGNLEFNGNKLTVGIGASNYPKHVTSNNYLELIKTAQEAAIYSKKKNETNCAFWNKAISKILDIKFENSGDFLTSNPIKDYKSMEMLLEAVKIIESTLNLEELLKKTVDIIIKLTEAERCIIMLLDNKDLKLKIKIAVDKNGSIIPETDLVYSQSIPYQVIEHGKPILLKEGEEKSITMSMIDFDIRSIMCAPLQVKENRFGVIYVDSRTNFKKFSQSDMVFFYTLTNQIAGAIENARLYDETLKMNQVILKINDDLVKHKDEILKSKEEIELLKNYLNNIIEFMPSMIISLNTNGEVLNWNAATTKFLKIELKDAINKNLFNIFPEFTKFKKEFQQVVKNNKMKEILRETITKNNKTTYHNIYIFSVDANDIKRIVVRIDDITELEKKEEQLRQTQKMELVGLLAGGLAHDFNNALGGIVGTLSLLEYKLSKNKKISDNELKESIIAMMIASKNAFNMVQQLLNLSRKKDSVFITFDLANTIKNVLKICKNIFDKRIDFKITLPKEKISIKGDPTQLEQVFLNLCVNSYHAMTIMRKKLEDYGGTLSISAEKIVIDKKNIKSYKDFKEGIYWKISVDDDGVGMNDEILSKIFTPFFTTKSNGTGTGLGLSMVYNIIKQHQGIINVTSKEGIGTSFKIYLPFYSEELEKEKDEEIFELPKGEGFILVIDDNDIMRQTTKIMLELCGFNVLISKDFDDALDIFNNKKNEIKLIIIDVIMPKRTGLEMYKELKKINNNIKVLLTSGFRLDDNIKEIINQGANGFIQKPFTIEKLSEEVFNILK